MSRAGLVVLVCALLLPETALLGFFTAGAVLSFPATAPRLSGGAADAVVVLGGSGDGARYPRARELLLAGLAKRLVLIEPSAAEVADATQRFSEVLVWNDVLPGNTWGEAKTTRARMAANGWKSVLVVSDPPHMLRMRYAWASNFWGADESYVLVASNPAWWSAWRWWQDPYAIKFVEEEVLKLGYYVVRYRFGL